MFKSLKRVAIACAALCTIAVAAPSAGSVIDSASAAVGDCTPGTGWGTVRSDYADRVVQLVNQHRSSLGLATLMVSPTLTKSAVWKSRHMAYYRYMTHDDPAPPVSRTIKDRLIACGYPAATSGWGENIAYGYKTPEEVMQGWLNSSGHRANVENPSFRVIGVGAAAASTGTIYWAQNFGSYDDSGSATTTPPPGTSTTTAFPGSTTIFTGTLRAGDATRLRADDNAYYQVSSSGGTVSWYGRVSGVPNTLRSLQVGYRGLNSAACTQTVSIWNWSGYWVTLDSRSVGTTELEVTALPSGTLASYVSGTTGNGDVAVRVRCTRTDSTAFYGSGDVMKIVYGV
jgi:uncharacterized protein YkwD